MTAQGTQPYSVRDIIDRYESEEDEFLRELEDMRQSIQTNEQEESVPQDPAPILSVLCSLVDEIGSLRSENRQLKTRLAPQPISRSKNVVQRMSAIFDNRPNFLPKLRRPPQHSEVRTGARERLSTPPRKECLTTSSISTDFSQDSRSRAPPLVEPELSDSDVDDNIFSEDQTAFERRGRGDTRRCEMSLSECTSPSSASSSRDPSEAMTSSRSSFLELFGFRRRRPDSGVNSPLPPTKTSLKKRKRRVSQDDINYTNESYRSRQQHKPPRPVSYYPREDSEDSDNMRCRKAASSLNVQGNYVKNAESLLRVDRETRLLHEKEGLAAEIEEMRMRNQRLVEQLREKSSQFSKLQVHVNKLERQVSILSQKCLLNETVEELTLDERLCSAPKALIEKVEQRLREFESHMQSVKLELNNNHQKAYNTGGQERLAHQTCLEHLEKLQSENFKLLQERYLECGSMDSSIRRKMDQLPSYEALFSFTNGIVRKLSEYRWNLLEKTSEVGKAEMDVLATQSSLLVTHAQMERLRIGLKNVRRRRKRPSSYHGEPYQNRLIKHDMNFFLPFKLQGSRVENMRRVNRRKSNEMPVEKNIEEEFLGLFGSNRVSPPIAEKAMNRPVSRIEHMMREMSSGGRQKTALKTYSPVMERVERSTRNDRRPISMVEVEDDFRMRRFDEPTRRSVKIIRQTSGDTPPNPRAVVCSLQDVNNVRSPNNTPLAARRLVAPERRLANRIYDPVDAPQQRTRKLERGYSTESRYEDRSIMDRRDEVAKLREDLTKEREERRRDEKRQSMQHEDRRPNRLQRSQPVQLSRIRPPTTITNKSRTLDGQRVETNKVERSRTLEHHEPKDPGPSVREQTTNYKDPITIYKDQAMPSRLPAPKTDKKTWLERIRAMRRT